jgi:hypothetical protein
VQGRDRRRVFLQIARHLPELYGAAHGGHGRAPGLGRVAARAVPAVGLYRAKAKDRAKLRALVPVSDDASAPPCSPSHAAPRPRAGRLPWADLLRRVFADDVLQCACGGRRSIVAVVTDPAVARTLLVALDLTSEPATFAPARDPPQTELAWDDPA